MSRLTVDREVWASIFAFVKDPKFVKDDEEENDANTLEDSENSAWSLELLCLISKATLAVANARVYETIKITFNHLKRGPRGTLSCIDKQDSVKRLKSLQRTLEQGRGALVKILYLKNLVGDFAPTVYAILQACPNLSIVRLDVFEMPKKQRKFRYSANFENVQTLLVGCSIRSAGYLPLEFLATFSGVKQLSFGSNFEGPVKKARLTANVDCLTLANQYNPALENLRKFLDPSLVNVRRLSIVDCMADVVPIMEACAGTLEELVYSHLHGDGREALQDDLIAVIGACKKLQHLSLSAKFWDPPSPFSWDLPDLETIRLHQFRIWISQFPSLIAGAKLKTVECTLCLPDWEEDPDLAEWRSPKLASRFKRWSVIDKGAIFEQAAAVAVQQFANQGVKLSFEWFEFDPWDFSDY